MWKLIITQLSLRFSFGSLRAFTFGSLAFRGLARIRLWPRSNDGGRARTTRRATRRAARSHVACRARGVVGLEKIRKIRKIGQV